MGSSFCLRGALPLLLASTALAGQARAQDAAPQMPGDIVVTAQKRSERLIDVPQSVTAIGAQDLRRLGAQHLGDVAGTVPGLTLTSSGVGQSQISLRGVTAGTDIGPTVGIYVDDVPYGSSSAFTNAASLGLDAGLFDLARVEVLRGPQGTLYGASAMGGVLRYITPTPDLTRMGGQITSGISFTDKGGTSYNTGVAVNIPVVSDVLAVRASGFVSHDGGFIADPGRGEHDLGRARQYGGRVDALYQPVARFSLRLTGQMQNIHRDGTATADYALDGQPEGGDLVQARVKDEPFDQRFRLASATMRYDLGRGSVTSISSYQTIRTSYRMDASSVYVPELAALGLDFSATPIDQTRSTDKFTQELRLASTGNGAVDWLVGGFYTHETSDNRQQILAYDPSGALSSVNLATSALPSTYEEAAVFGNATLHLSNALDVTGGLRYAHNDQTFTQNASGLLLASAPSSHAGDGVVTYLANARYRWGRHVTAYLRYATGYRPGGPNFVARDLTSGALLAPTNFKPDTLRSYEGGIKAETADGTFHLDASGYHIDWNNIQTATSAGGLSVIANAGRAKVDGAELTLKATPTHDFSASAAFAWQHARLAEDAPTLGAVKGENLPNVPRLTAAIIADYTASDLRLKPSLGLTLRFISDRTASFNQSAGLPQYHLPAYATLDLRAGVELGPVQAQIFAHNLTNSRGQLSASTALSVLGGPAQVTIIQPRTIGLSATTRF